MMPSRCLLCLVSLAAAGLVGCRLFPLQGPEPVRIDRPTAAGLPTKYSQRISQFVFFSDFEIPRNHPLFRDLGGLRDQVAKELRLEGGTNLIQVHLFENREKYEAFMQVQHPDLPRRRAFFVAQPRRLGGSEDLLVYTCWGDRIQQDLRHELTHALLHSVLKDVPLWLDEGLAEFFEVPAGWSGLNYQHLEQLVRAGQVFDMDRLEGLADVQQMSPAEYRESWAWVHYMLRGNPRAKQVLLDYLRELRTDPRPGPLRPRLTAAVPNLHADLLRHLAALEKTRTAGAAAKR